MVEKKNVIQAVIACIVGLAIYALCVAISLHAYTDEFARCDDGYTIWRINQSAFSSAMYEIRSGIVRIDWEYNWQNYRPFMREHNCKMMILKDV